MVGARWELKLWRWQRTSALILLPLVAFHLGYQYFIIGLDGLSFGSVSAKLSTGVLLVIDVLLLAVALSHGLLGLRAIVLDYARAAKMSQRTTIAIVLACALVGVYGLAALLAFL